MATSGTTFSDFGTAASDIFAGLAAADKIKGDELSQQAYGEAASLADLNAQYTEMSTAIQQSQADRELFKAQGRTESEVAGAGFTEGGSALDILRENASQGALQKAVIGYQGQITEAGFREQAQSYELMANAAGEAAKGENLAEIGDFVAAGTSAVAGMATMA